MVDENIEKSLKRFLKRKVSVNESVVVKFLITGLIGATLTACGGGGGGGGSSSGGVTPLPKPENSMNVSDVFGKNEITNKEDIVLIGEKTDSNISNKPAISVKNSTITNEAKLSLSGEKVTAISGMNSTIINKANITLHGEGATALKGEVNTVLRNKALEISIQNNGNISLEGKNQTGIFITSKNGKISGINNGTIDVKGENGSGMKSDGNGSTITNNGSIKVSQNFIPESDNLDPRTQMSKGMYILNGSTGINNKNIEVQGSSVGMFADGENSKAINKGTITLSGKDPENDNYVPTIGMGALDGGILKNDGKIISNVNSATIMYAENGSIENNGSIEMNGNDNDGIIGDLSNITNNGTITGTGDDIAGMETSGKGFKAVNNKDIILTGEYNYGMGAIEGATAINEKNATISINGNNSVGMGAENFGSEAINKGNIKINGNNSVGMITEDSNSKIVNNGTIEVVGTNSAGIYVSNENSVPKTKEELLKTATTNKGMITIDGTNSTGIYVHTKNREHEDVWGASGINQEGATINVNGTENMGMFGYNSDVMNLGIINVNGINSAGMKTSSLSFADNYKNITVTGENSVGMLSENGGRVSNEKGGIIDVTGKNSFAMKATGIGSLARNEEGAKINISAGNSGIVATGRATALNDENATISTTGENSIGMIARSDSQATNKGSITINNNFKIDTTSENGVFDENFLSEYLKDFSFGMKGLGNNSLITNSREINIFGSSIGMYTENGNAINDGTINIESNVPNDEKEYKAPIGMVATGNGIATNNGTIIGSGNGDIQGMFAYNGGTVINGEKGKINLDGEFTTALNGINGNVINNGSIEVNGGNGIEISGGSATNNGTIKLTGNYVRGISSENGNVTNKKDILIEGNNSAGLYAGLDDTIPPKEVSLINDVNGKINIKGDDSSGIENHCSSYKLTNKGLIDITGGNTYGIYSFGDNVTIENYGDINLKFTDSNSTTGEYSNITGVLTNGNNNIVKNNSKIEILGNIDLPYDKDSKTCYFYGIRSNDEIEGNNNTITNEKDGKIIININKTVENANVYATGIHSNFAGTTINNLGEISISGVNDSKGIYGYDSIINNSGKITVNGGNNYGIQGNEGSTITNTGSIELNGYFAWGIDEGIPSFDKKTTVNNSGEIKINGSNGIGINALSNSKITNLKDGKIIINGDYGVGIKGGNSQIINGGDILITSENLGESSDSTLPHSTGIYLGENDGTSTVKNSGNITMTGNKSVGICASNGTITNEKGGKISVTGDMGIGLYISGQAFGSAVNNGEIIVKGNDNEGIFAGQNTTATNNGVIIVIGNNSSGMNATQGATVINDSDGTININGKKSYGMKANGVGSSATNKGTINVGVNASGGMLATNGATISNEGTINIDSSHKLTDDTKEGFALQTQGEGSTIKNTGIIKADGTVTVTSGTNYVLGTTKSGSYGRISAKSINLDGNVIVDSTIASVDFKDSYTLDNAISSEETKLGKDFKVSSNTMLYNATAKKDDSKNNVDVELSRNENNLVDFTSKEYDNLASVFDKGINDKEFRDTLSDEAKEVLNNVFANTTSGQNIQNRLKEISGVEYTNIARQIFDTKDIFKSYDSSIINTLDDYQFNFSFIGNYSDVEAKGNLLGYDSKMTGISGAMKFNDSLYGVIGYGYNDIDFDGKSEGNIKSVHTGIYKDMKLNSFDVRLGVFGEYNFHEVERDLTSDIAKGDFNSYLLGATGEISQRFGDSLYVKPTLSLDVTYGRYEDFTEEGAKGYNFAVDSQDYTSIVPAVEVKVGKDFEMASIYSAVKFGYEFGDMNKLQYAKLGEFDKKALPFTDEIENAQTDIKVGTAFEYNNFTFNAEVGKEFGKRDREYITAGFTYTF